MRALERVGALAGRAPELIVAVDRAEAIAALGALAATRGRRIGVLVDLDVGQRRTGVTAPQAARDLAAAASRTAGIDYAGAQAYWGHLQHVAAHAERRRAIAEPMGRLAAAVDALRRAGLPPRIVSGGGTGSCDVDHHRGLFTESQPGSYVMMDAQYDAVEIWPGNARRFGPAMRVLARVVSAHQPDRATTDAGSKALSTDGPLPRFLAPERARDVYAFAGDEFGIVRYGDPPAARLAVGDPVEMLAPHCDTTANLHAFFHCLRGDRLVEIWPIVGRGTW